MSKTFEEVYLVKFSFISDKGLMRFRQEDVFVTVTHGVNEKNNHKKAEKALLEKYKNYKDVKITSVVYV